MGIAEWVVVGVFAASVVVGVFAWMVSIIRKAIERLFENIEMRISALTIDMASAFKEVQKEITQNTAKISSVEKDLAVLQAEHKINHGRGMNG